MLNYQLDFFKSEEESRLEALEAEISKLRTSLDKQRKSQFAKIGEQKKEIESLKSRLDILERNICKNET